MTLILSEKPRPQWSGHVSASPLISGHSAGHVATAKWVIRPFHFPPNCQSSDNHSGTAAPASSNTENMNTEIKKSQKSQIRHLVG